MWCSHAESAISDTVCFCTTLDADEQLQSDLGRVKKLPWFENVVCPVCNLRGQRALSSLLSPLA